MDSKLLFEKYFIIFKIENTALGICYLSLISNET